MTSATVLNTFWPGFHHVRSVNIGENEFQNLAQTQIYINVQYGSSRKVCAMF